MDQLKNMAGKMGGNKEGEAKPQGGQAAGKEDYGDKGLDAVEKKFGMSQSRETNEKITDAGRDFIEKQSGKDIPDKYSN